MCEEGSLSAAAPQCLVLAPAEAIDLIYILTRWQ